MVAAHRMLTGLPRRDARGRRDEIDAWSTRKSLILASRVSRYRAWRAGASALDNHESPFPTTSLRESYHIIDRSLVEVANMMRGGLLAHP